MSVVVSGRGKILVVAAAQTGSNSRTRRKEANMKHEKQMRGP
jgi:hypothetical protein